MEDVNDVLKVVIVGDGGCGKTVLLHAYTNRDFDEKYIPTVLDTYSADIKIGEKKIPIEIYDTAGQEDFTDIRNLVYPGSNVFMMCYSCVNKGSLQNISKFWSPETSKAEPGVPIVLVGNKLDLKDKQSKDYISDAEAEAVQAEVKAKEHLQCSAFNESKGIDDAKNVEKVFKFAIKYGLQHKRNPPAPPVKPCEKWTCSLL